MLDLGSSLLFWGIALIVDMVLLYLAVFLMVKYGIDPNKQRRRILQKIEKLPEYKDIFEEPLDFDGGR